MNKQLQTFSEKIMALSPKYINVFGRGMPGMGGTSAGTTGAANSATDVTLRLQHSVINFIHMYENDYPAKVLKPAVQEIEGLIMTEQTLSVLTPDEANGLLDQLYDLLEAKEGKE